MTTESLYVNGFNSVNEQWTETGISPWLNDNVANYINTKNDEVWCEEFAFANHVGSETLNSVTLYIEINGPSSRKDYVVIDLHNGSSWNNVVNQDPDGDAYVWYNFDVSSLLDSWTKVNAAKLRVQYQKSGSPSTEQIYIRRAYLYIDYSSVETPILVSDGLFLNDGIGKERRFTISDGVGASDGLPLTNRAFTLIDVLDLLDAILKQRDVSSIQDTVDLVEVVSKHRLLSVISDVLGLSDVVTRGKTLILDDTISLTEALALLRALGITDSLTLTDGILKERGLSIQDTATSTDFISKHRTLGTIIDGLNLNDSVMRDKTVLIMGGNITINDAVTLLRTLAITDTLSLGDNVVVVSGGTQVLVSDVFGLLDSILKERWLSTTDAISLSDNQLIDKPTLIVTDAMTLLDALLNDKTIKIIDSFKLSESVKKHVWESGWSGEVMNILNPAKVSQIPREKIKKIAKID